MQHRAPQPTVPGTGIYAGKMYTEEERAEIKRRNCLTHGQRVQENYADHCFYLGVSLLICVLLAAMYFIIPAIELSVLG